jgi:L-threonylcarbamoyladenylate synthase
VVLSALLAGEPVVLPTDTVYGLCSLPVEDAVARLRALKGTPQEQPIALLCGSLEGLFQYAPWLEGRPELVLLPGPYTLVLRNPERAFPWMAGSRPDTLGVRVPELRGEALAAVIEVGGVAATSANVHDGPDPRRLEDVPAEIRSRVGALLDGGELPGTPSTVIDFTDAEPRVLREGAAPSADAIRRVRSRD